MFLSWRASTSATPLSIHTKKKPRFLPPYLLRQYSQKTSETNQLDHAGVEAGLVPAQHKAGGGGDWVDGGDAQV